MQRLTTLFRTLKLYAGVLLLFLSIHGVAFAQRRGQEEESSGTSGNLWVFGYFITGLGIALGMIVLCRSARRHDRAKPKQYESLVGKD